MVNLDMITKNPAHMAIAAGAVVLAATVISKGKNVAGVKKKTVQYLGGALILGGLGYKYVLKKGGNGTGPVILPAPAAPTLPAGSLPPGATPVMPVGPVPTLPQVPGNLTSPGPTIGGTPSMPGPSISNYSRSRVANAARKAYSANANTLGVFYNDVA
jgi:hypothetical protein